MLPQSQQLQDLTSRLVRRTSMGIEDHMTMFQRDASVGVEAILVKHQQIRRGFFDVAFRRFFAESNSLPTLVLPTAGGPKITRKRMALLSFWVPFRKVSIGNCRADADDE
jgi:hypothetical protein